LVIRSVLPGDRHRVAGGQERAVVELRAIEHDVRAPTIASAWRDLIDESARRRFGLS
jgi:hypothetical protein